MMNAHTNFSILVALVFALSPCPVTFATVDQIKQQQQQGDDFDRGMTNVPGREDPFDFRGGNIFNIGDDEGAPAPQADQNKSPKNKLVEADTKKAVVKKVETDTKKAPEKKKPEKKKIVTRMRSWKSPGPDWRMQVQMAPQMGPPEWILTRVTSLESPGPEYEMEIIMMPQMTLPTWVLRGSQTPVTSPGSSGPMGVSPATHPSQLGPIFPTLGTTQTPSTPQTKSIFSYESPGPDWEPAIRMMPYMGGPMEWVPKGSQNQSPPQADPNNPLDPNRFGMGMPPGATPIPDNTSKDTKTSKN